MQLESPNQQVVIIKKSTVLIPYLIQGNRCADRQNDMEMCLFEVSDKYSPVYIAPANHFGLRIFYYISIRSF
jgi:hypothetical protein